MRDEMGTFRVDIELENPARPGAKRVVAGVLVDTGAELSWVPAEVLESLGVTRNNRWRFRQADGTVLERWTGSDLIRVLGKHAADEVVFGPTVPGTDPPAAPPAARPLPPGARRPAPAAAGKGLLPAAP